MKMNKRGSTVRWLARIGYDVSVAREDEVEQMLVREARQWDLTPERLEEMIHEDHVRESAPRSEVAV